jgi:hypothetical protein
MKKNLENLLFTLSENAEFSQVSHEKFNGLQVDCKDGTLIKIYETLIPQELSVEIISSPEKSSIIVNSEKIMSFLDYSHLQIERDQSFSFVEKFGQKVFNRLKENALMLLSGKVSEMFSIKDEQSKQYNSFELTLHNQFNSTKASININYDQRVTSVNPLRVTVMAVLDLLKENDISNTFMHFFIPQHKIKDYSFIHLNILGYKDEATFIDDLISSHTKSKVLSYFKLNCELDKKEIKIPKRKI